MPDSTKYTAKLRGARALVIGGSSGIGQGVAAALLEHGARVAIASSSRARVDAAVASLLESYPSASSRLTGHVCDLGEGAEMEGRIEALFEEVVGGGGGGGDGGGGDGGGAKLDHVVITAGGAVSPTRLADASFASIVAVGTVRFFAPLLVAKCAARHLAPGPRSSVTLTTGATADRPVPGWTVTSCYASAMYGMARGLALDMAPVRVNVVCPGAVDTPFWEGFKQNGSWEGMQEQIARVLCTGRIGRVEDVVEAYLFAIKDENATGGVISTNGGSLLK